MFCREQAARFSRRIDAVRERGAEVYAIGNGSPAQARLFVRLFEIPYPVLTDPTRSVYDLAGMRYGIRHSLRPVVVARALRAVRAGHRQSLPQGDPSQHGGVLVVAPPGELVWAHVGDGPGDLVEVETVVDVLPRARTG